MLAEVILVIGVPKVRALRKVRSTTYRETTKYRSKATRRLLNFHKIQTSIWVN